MRIRGQEEIQGSLQAFKDVYEAQFGKPFDTVKAINVIREMLEKAEVQIIQQRFFDFRPQDLKLLMEMLEPKSEEKPKRGRPKNDQR